MADAGIRVARPGWNATTAPDWALVYSSQWPSLTIAFETTVTISSSLTYVKHNLGFKPLLMAWLTYNGTGYGRAQTDLEVTDTEVTNLPGAPVGGLLRIVCFNIDISKDANYPLLQSASAKFPADLTTGIKFVKGSRSINSPNLNDFILNSQAQSPAVLDVCTEKGQYFNNGKIIYPLQTSYIPWFLGATTLSGGYYLYANESLFSYDTATHSLVFDLGGVFGSAGTLIVLRDPLFYPNTVRVVY
jgi:hypothetical protein